MTETRTVLESAEISRALTRISHEIIEANKGVDGLVLIGIPTRGSLLAQRIADTISRIEGIEVPVGSLDVTLYRDDLARQPTRAPLPTEMPVTGIDGATVVLVDDVLYSGRTVRAALDALGDHGRPTSVRLAALIDRGHRELPIRADYIGKNLPSAKHERISVRLQELDGEDAVTIS
ncbi:bifunctional pyr operon transcriptional regulator/uracil phosphoribosyltransferase PyrR [Leucobacter insecticola]|uniref:Bifunctional protein PyrR n=1 Tax=Leucobacter insecticola TaxID=2714934 RepID=A0A6G8FJQ9_9MICO|nr:bifunctional pyr operon transcriptional regulator/uracil phosphoribosyltransferase PyrR [Leucobacter insecticola]QIM16605.1 bifunctional pyr operon transcriptional regulator/uracil phosphoribosyltransferase PyrR [Leucobacter insecticola]